MSGLRYDPEWHNFVMEGSGDYFGHLRREVHERDPSLGHTMAAGPDLLEAAKQLDRLSLIIQSAVARNYADPDYNAVLAAIGALRAAAQKAEGETP